MKCTNCSNEIKDGLEICPICGKNPYIKQKINNHIYRKLIIVILCIMLIVAVAYYMYVSGWVQILLNKQIFETSSTTYFQANQSFPSSSESSENIVATKAQSVLKYVYVTQSGTKYHRSACSSLSGNVIEMTEEDAIKNGYEPCQICRPDSDENTSISSKQTSQSSTSATQTTISETTSIASTNQNTAPTSVETTTAILRANSTVYISESGKKYHLKSCSSLSGDSIIEISVYKALQKGCGPCSKCNPGIYPYKVETTTKTRATKQKSGSTQSNSSEEENTETYIVNNNELRYYHNANCKNIDGTNTEIFSVVDITNNHLDPCPDCKPKKYP